MIIYIAPLAWTARSVVLGQQPPLEHAPGGAGVAATAGSLAFGLAKAARSSLRGSSGVRPLVRRLAFPTPSQVLWAFIVGPSNELEETLLKVFVLVVLGAILVAVGALYSTHTFLILTGQVPGESVLEQNCVDLQCPVGSFLILYLFHRQRSSINNEPPSGHACNIEDW